MLTSTFVEMILAMASVVEPDEVPTKVPDEFVMKLSVSPLAEVEFASPVE